MSPANGRPPSENPKEHTFQMRLSNYDEEILEKCRQTYGLAKSATLLFGLQILDFASENREFRQLIDALVILKQIEDRKEKMDSEDYKYLIGKQKKQIKYNFDEFMNTYEK